MDNSKYFEILNTIKLNLLSPNANNIDNLLEDTKILFNKTNYNNNKPYVDTLKPDFSYLNNYLDISKQAKNKNNILEALAKSFSGTLKFHHPQVMHNVIPNGLISSIAGMTIANLFNLNSAWDLLSAGAHSLERQVVKILANYAGWDINTAGGISTFGGKGCIMYAVRIGLNRCLPKISSEGIYNSSHNTPVILTSKDNHLSIDSVASVLGIGVKNVWRCDTYEDETMNLESFKHMLIKALENKHPIACIIFSGGNTAHLAIDDLRQANTIIDEMVEKYKLNYRPYIYFDTCVSWAWMLFKNYNFTDNPLNIEQNSLVINKKIIQKLSAVELADGFGTDFHKTGLSSYASSVFMCKNTKELESMLKENTFYSEKSWGNNLYFQMTIEHSKPASGIIACWMALQLLAEEGFIVYLSYLLTIGLQLRTKLIRNDIEILNDNSLSVASVFAIKPKGFKYNFNDLYNCSIEEIKEYNDYLFKLFEFFQNKQDNSIDEYIFRYIPAYKKTQNGLGLSALVMHPMSIFIKQQDIDIIANNILKIKNIFDLKEQNQQVEIPSYIPR